MVWFNFSRGGDGLQTVENAAETGWVGGPFRPARYYDFNVRGTVEIESIGTAARRGYEFPEGFEVKSTVG